MQRDKSGLPKYCSGNIDRRRKRRVRFRKDGFFPLHDLSHPYASPATGRRASLQMIGKLLGHRVATTTARYVHLTRDAASAVYDQLGDAMTAAIANGKAPTVNVVKFPKRRRRQP